MVEKNLFFIFAFDGIETGHGSYVWSHFHNKTSPQAHNPHNKIITISSLFLSFNNALLVGKKLKGFAQRKAPKNRLRTTLSIFHSAYLSQLDTHKGNIFHSLGT